MLACLFLSALVRAQHQHPSVSTSTLPDVPGVDAQPLLAQAIRLNEALSYFGSALSADDQKRLKELQHKLPGEEIATLVQDILDPYCLAMVEINPEARVKVIRGPAKAKLVKEGWTSFLVKVHNQAGVTARLEVESPNTEPALHISSGEPEARKEHMLTPGQLSNRFMEMSINPNRPLQPDLSGLRLEYAVLQIYSKQSGRREAEIAFNIGHGSQDIGFRNSISILFDIEKPVTVNFVVKDDDGSPTIASFIIRDDIERMEDSPGDFPPVDYRARMAQLNYRVPSKELIGLYPLPSRRVAAYDEYPDFFFQPQVYRSDGEHVQLPPGKYRITFTRGPEYISQESAIIIPPGVASHSVSFRLKRWINMAKLGWYSADHHVHAAGCSHYESPEEGVKPFDMWRQALGEDLNIAAVLAWGPGWYHQKTFFTGHNNPLSTQKNILRNDVEVSGFPSSHAGHIVLLRLKEDDYPGTKKIEEWPSWTLPVLKWAKSQNALTGYAHSGWGLEPSTPTNALPNYILPKMDGIGANEFVVTVTEQAVDFYSAGDTPAPWELNMWYHTLNCGFNTPLSGETDFPCIYDERIGMARSYFKPDGALNYDSYVSAIKKGRSYVSDGSSHITGFSVNGTEMGTNDSKTFLKEKQQIKITAKIAANLPEQQSASGAAIAGSALNQQPYWHIERARVGKTRSVPVELIVNGQPVDTINIVADGQFKDVNFSYALTQSCWLALRVYPSSHSNPVFAIVNGKPIRVKRSAEWCRLAVDQCWKMKQSNIRAEERPAADAAYQKARMIYSKIISEAQH